MSGKPAAHELATKSDIERLIDMCLVTPRRSPPPHDEEAERLLVAAARAGYVAEVDPAFFFSDARGAIFDAVRHLTADGFTRLSDPEIIRYLEVAGWAPLRIELELDACRVDPRAVRLEELAGRVREAARRRRALDLLLQAEEQLRGGGAAEAITDLLVRAADEVGS